VGDHTFSVTARDAVGNVDASPETFRWTVAPSAGPDTAVTSGPPLVSSSASATFSFTGTGAASYTCRMDGTPTASCTSPVSFTGLDEGPHTLLVAAVDSAGNEDKSPALYQWTVDTFAPNTKFDGVPPTFGHDASVVVTFSSNEPTSTFSCRLDGETWKRCVSPLTIGPLVDGAHSLEVYAVDAAGNADLAKEIARWTVDTVPPETTLQGGPAPFRLNNPRPSFWFGASEESSFECSVDEGAFAPCTSGDRLPALHDGPHTFAVRAIDRAMNVDATPAFHAWTLDTTAPDTTLEAPLPFETTKDVSATFFFSSEDASASFVCKLEFTDSYWWDDAPGWAACESPATVQFDHAGRFSFLVAAVDKAGNQDPSPAEYEIVVDRTAPSVDFLSGPARPSNSAAPAFAFVCSKEPCTYTCSLDAGPFAPCSSPRTVDVRDGAHTFEVRASDALGNAAPRGTVYSWTADLVPPETTITTETTEHTSSRSASFSLRSTEPGSFRCQFDSEPSQVCGSWVWASDVPDGTHTLTAWAIDEAGTSDPTPETFSWVVDTVAPTITLTSGPSEWTQSNTASITFSVDEQAATLCSLDYGEFTSCTSPWQGSSLSEDQHNLRIMAKDASQNSAFAQIVWNVDKTPPNIWINTYIDSPINSSSVTISASFIGASRLDCTLDGNLISSCAFPLTLTGIMDGTHTLAVTATDKAGNSNTQNLTWTVDVTPPATPANFKLNNHGRSWSATWSDIAETAEYRIKYSRSSASGPFDKTIHPAFKFDPLAVGTDWACSNVYAVLVAVDSAGNESTASPVQSLRIQPTWSTLQARVSVAGGYGVIRVTASRSVYTEYGQQNKVRVYYSDSSFGADKPPAFVTQDMRLLEPDVFGQLGATITLTGFPDNAPRYVRVVPVDGTCEGEWSEEFVASPHPWEVVSPLPTPNSLKQIACAAGGTSCTAVGSLGTSIHTSDGTEWSRGGSTGESAALESVALFSSYEGFSIITSPAPALWDEPQPTLLKTVDGGHVWTAFAQRTNTPAIHALAARSFDLAWAAGNDGAIYKISGEGATWTKQISGTLSVLRSVVAASDTMVVAVGDGGTIRTTTDGGSSWGARTSGVTTHLLSVACFDSNRCWAVGNSGVIVATTNGGTTWTQQTSGTTATLRGVSFASASVGWGVGDSGTVLATTNGGTSWTAQTSGETGNLNSVSATSTSAVWFVGDAGILRRTTNGGTTWTDLRKVTTPGPLTAVHARSASEVLVAASGGAVLSSSDGLKTVAKATPSAATMNAFWFVDGSTGYAAGGNGTILKTTNHGSSWTQVANGGGVELRDVHCVSATDCWVAGGTSLLHTTNGGASWSSLPTGIAFTPTTSSVRFESASVGYMGIDKSASLGSQNIFKTTDGGALWSFVGFVGSPYDSSWSEASSKGIVLELFDGPAAGAVVTAGSRTGIVTSAPGGSQFTPRGADNVVRLARRGNRAVGVGSNGHVTTTLNAGTDWSDSPTETSVFLRSASMGTDDVVYVVGDNGVILRTASFGR
jgi:photosystem II stability/assembly factor-like uncharacterized protein